MGQPFDYDAGLPKGAHGRQIGAMGREQRVDQHFAMLQSLLRIAAGDDAANERITVGVRAAAGQTQEQIARLHGLRAGKEGVPVNQADDGSGDVA